MTPLSHHDLNSAPSVDGNSSALGFSRGVDTLVAALDVYRGGIAAVSSFGAVWVVLLALVAEFGTLVARGCRSIGCGPATQSPLPGGDP